MTSPKPDRLKKFLKAAATDATATSPKRESAAEELDKRMKYSGVLNQTFKNNPDMLENATIATKADSAARDEAVVRKMRKK